MLYFRIKNFVLILLGIKPVFIEDKIKETDKTLNIDLWNNS